MEQFLKQLGGTQAQDMADWKNGRRKGVRVGALNSCGQITLRMNVS